MAPRVAQAMVGTNPEVESKKPDPEDRLQRMTFYEKY